MREILFRGKRKDNGEWVEGYLVTARYYLDNSPVTIMIPSFNPYSDTSDPILYPNSEISGYEEVVLETVGQYTGLTDKNGKKIFEGDIVKTQEMYDRPFSQKRKSKRHIGVVEYKIRSCGGSFNPKTGNWDRHEEYLAEWIVNVADYGRFSCSAWGDFYDCEVIGNIHDNPDLLKGGAEE